MTGSLAAFGIKGWLSDKDLGTICPKGSDRDPNIRYAPSCQNELSGRASLEAETEEIDLGSQQGQSALLRVAAWLLTSSSFTSCWPEGRASSDQSLRRCPQRNGFKSTGNFRSFLSTGENPY